MEFKNDIHNECAFNIYKAPVCSSKNIIDKLKNIALNFNVEPEKIKNDGDVIDVLKKKLNCDGELCVLNNNAIKIKIGADIIEKNIEENFKPEGPKNSFNWLSNDNIDNVLKQIKEKYDKKNFLHIPFQMIDFEKTDTELSRLNFPEEMKNGYKTFGVILNTDKSTGNGIHWFAIFGDFSREKGPHQIEYFNSSGEPPMDEILVWMKRVKHQWARALNAPVLDIIVSEIQHQYDSHSCGVYSLYYIISRLDGVDCKYFSNNRIPDEVMHMFRKYLFIEK